MKAELRKDLAWRRVAGELFVVDAAGSRLHEFNGPAALIWECLAAGKDESGIVASLTAEFDVTPAGAAADLAGFMKELASAGLLRETVK